MSVTPASQVNFEPPLDPSTICLDRVIQRLTQERLTKYLFRAGQDKNVAVELYTWNHQVGETLTATLQQFEICLRNCISAALADAYGPEWHKSHLIRCNNSDVNTEWDRTWEKARGSKGGFDPKPPDFVAAATFNLWRELCKPRYVSVFWTNRLHIAFPHVQLPIQQRAKPTDHAKLNEIHRRVDLLLKLRNRIAHHEPILGHNRERLGAKLKERHREMIETLNWMDPNFARWVVTRDRFHRVFSRCPCTN